MKSFLVLIATLSCSICLSAAPPNVIFILADDQGSVDVGCYGTKDLVTPNTDALAARGVRFTQFYSAAPVCSPSRAGALTGRWPARAGVPTNCASQKGAKGALPPEEVTMAEMFKAAGYATAHVGKWHIGYTPETSPQAQGFDHTFGHMGGCIDNYSHFFFWSGPNIHDLWRNGTEVHHDGDAPVPWFITGFAAVLVCNSLVDVPEGARALLLDLSKGLLLLAVTATAMRSRLDLIAELGWRASIPVVTASLASLGAALAFAIYGLT